MQAFVACPINRGPPCEYAYVSEVVTSKHMIYDARKHDADATITARARERVSQDIPLNGRVKFPFDFARSLIVASGFRQGTTRRSFLVTIVECVYLCEANSHMVLLLACGPSKPRQPNGVIHDPNKTLKAIQSGSAYCCYSRCYH